MPLFSKTSLDTVSFSVKQKIQYSGEKFIDVYFLSVRTPFIKKKTNQTFMELLNPWRGGGWEVPGSSCRGWTPMATSPSLRSLNSCVTTRSPETEVPVRGDEQGHRACSPDRTRARGLPRGYENAADGRRTSDVCTRDISRVARTKAVSLPVRKTANLAWTCWICRFSRHFKRSAFVGARVSHWW